MHSKKKRHRRKKPYINSPFSRVSSTQAKFISVDKNYHEGTVDDKNEEDSEKIDEIYKIFFARLMKIFILKSDNFKSINISEADLDRKLLETSNTYYDFDEFIYNVSSYTKIVLLHFQPFSRN